MASPRAEFDSPQLPTFNRLHKCFPTIFRFAKIHLYFSHFLSHRIYLPSLTSMPCSMFSRFHCICMLTILHLSKNEGGFLICHKCHWGFLLFASIWCPTASGCEGVGVSTQTGGGIQIWGVATYRRCTNIPRQEMSCQGALGIERGVERCHREVN